MVNSEKLVLKLLVDKDKNLVVFAESNKDFVDILLSYLTLPLGTIIRLLNKKSSLGCFNQLYDSIENLDTDCLETEACKNMLLQPRSASEMDCEDLKINVNDLEPRSCFRCPLWHVHCFKVFNQLGLLYATVSGVPCHCGRTMDNIWYMDRRNLVADKKDGVFVKGGAKRFMVTDDFQVMDACTAHSLAILERLGISDLGILEETVVEVCEEEVLSLLGRFLMSKTPLSEVFLGKKQVTLSAVDVRKGKQPAENKLETVINEDLNVISLKLLVNKDNGEVLYAEAKDDFVNLLFSFLTFPLSSILKLLNGHSMLGCVDNLYNSVDVLGNCEDESIKSESSKAMLKNPKLAQFFACDNQILEMEEMPPPEIDSFEYNGMSHLASCVNPKMSGSQMDGRGRFVKGPSRFMVTSDLVISPMSPIAVFNLMKEIRVPISNLEERIVNVGESEALNILKSSLISGSALSSALSAMPFIR